MLLNPGRGQIFRWHSTMTFGLESNLVFLLDTPRVRDIDSLRSKRCEGESISLRQGCWVDPLRTLQTLWKLKLMAALLRVPPRSYSIVRCWYVRGHCEGERVDSSRRWSYALPQRGKRDHPVCYDQRRSLWSDHQSSHANSLPVRTGICASNSSLDRIAGGGVMHSAKW